MRINILAFAVVLIQACTGLPLDHGNLYPRTDEPCKQVREHVAKWMSDNGIVPKNLTSFERLFLPTVPAVPIRPSVAFACLKSIKLNRKTALEQLEFLRPLLEWHSTLDYLRNPPRGYLSEGVDILRGIDDIAAKVKRGRNGYANEFEFLADVYTLISIRIRDGHVGYPPVLMDLFTFCMGVQFISISKDGLSLPKIYVYDDVHYADRGYTPSPVATIDGVPALDFLQKLSVRAGWAHDPDARFNVLFPSAAINANSLLTGSEIFTLHLDDRTTVKYQNGTSVEFANTAFVRGNFTGINSGADLYSHFGQGNATAPQPISWGWYEWTKKNFTANMPGYPEPLTRTWQGHAAGFLPDGELSDVAVLGINSFTAIFNPSDFSASDLISASAMHNVTVSTIRAAKAAGRSKLILDLQGNGGGYMVNLAVLYFNLFPGNVTPLLWQGRAHPQLEWLGKELWNSTTPPPGQLPMGFNMLLKPDGTAWESFEEFYGPVNKHGGRFTHAGVMNATRDLTAFDFHYEPPWTEPPYKPSDIIIVTDGQCASACAMLVSMLVHHHGVRTISLGGRPLKAPMQAIGMTKGGPVLSMSSFPDSVNRSHVPDGLNIPPPSDYRPPLRVSRPETPNAGWGDYISVNMANTMPVGDDEENALPLQMRYEAANCKLFFTWEMTSDITAVWKAVAKAAWGGGKCVSGSTTRRDGAIGGVPGYTKGVEDRWKLGNGPGAI